VCNAAFQFIRSSEDWAANFEGVACAEHRRRLLLDASDAHTTADLRLVQRAIDERFDERLIVNADKPVTTARKL
jgi:hypothetical protein